MIVFIAISRKSIKIINSICIIKIKLRKKRMKSVILKHKLVVRQRIEFPLQIMQENRKKA